MIISPYFSRFWRCSRTFALIQILSQIQEKLIFFQSNKEKITVCPYWQGQAGSSICNWPKEDNSRTIRPMDWTRLCRSASPSHFCPKSKRSILSTQQKDQKSINRDIPERAILHPPSDLREVLLPMLFIEENGRLTLLVCISWKFG
jgi:hypothetical protein